MKTKNRKVRLARNTTWRCGKLEKGIVRFLLTNRSYVKEDVSVNDVIQQFPEEQKVREALSRLEKRSIIIMRNIKI